MPRSQPMDPLIVAALRTVSEGHAALLSPEQLTQLVEIGLVVAGPRGYAPTWAGKHRLGSSRRVADAATLNAVRR